MSVSLCTVSGTILDLGGSGVVNATVRWSSSAPVLDANNNLLTPTEVQTTTGYTFTVTSANATLGAVYSAANGQQFTVSTTIASGVTLVATSASPVAGLAASGTLTKVSGTGDAAITYSAILSGTWSLVVVQGTSGNFIVDYPPNAFDSQQTLYFPALVPASSSATFASIWNAN